ncbi:MAG: nucleotidyl transferase AbiEii/AbiGii toxin family protein [Elusimicrobiota bacterium]|jgi:predicted nucleotidyltransferase component of viral defense system|nr:nucleotidyl transferase AbiEii/AbiGii toxin family protein [Elusimicrobiota bacterium]
MTKREIKNISASIKAKLYHIARQKKVDFNAFLLKYMQERLLHRLSISEYRDKFILKGGLLLVTIDVPASRPTVDIDFSAKKIKNDREIIKEAFINISGIAVEDGVIFDTKTIRISGIMEDADYEGVRVSVDAYLGTAKNRLQIDLGFGDVITPAVRTKVFPSILGMDKTTLNVYPLETIVAEKYEAMIKRELINSRMKDFYDVYVILKENKLSKETLKEAITKTFKSRKRDPPQNPFVFTPAFYNNATKQTQWKYFLKKNKITGVSEDFKDIVLGIRDMLITVFK